MDAAARLLIVDDDAVFAAAAARLASMEGCDVTLARDCAQARSCLQAGPLDLVLIDLGLPDGSGLDLLDELDPAQHGRVVVLTGNPSLDSAVRACSTPAAEYLLKPLDPERWMELVREARPAREAREARLLHTGLIGQSPGMRAALANLLRAAPSAAAVLISGESGTGKALAARTLHHASHRMGPFVAVDCASLGPEHFCADDGTGLLGQAVDGTLCLDEPSRLGAPAQAALARALDARSGHQAGGPDAALVPARIVATTTTDLLAEVEQGRLREDLYYRLAEVAVHLPPLRDRGRDVVLLAHAFIERLNTRSGERRRLAPRSERILMRHSWPGNVRELQASVQRAYALEPGPQVVPAPLQRSVPDLQETRTSVLFNVGMTLADVERRMLLKTLAYYDQDRTATARVLGISVRTVHNRLARIPEDEREALP